MRFLSYLVVLSLPSCHWSKPVRNERHVSETVRHERLASKPVGHAMNMEIASLSQSQSQRQNERHMSHQVGILASGMTNRFLRQESVKEAPADEDAADAGDAEDASSEGGSDDQSDIDTLEDEEQSADQGEDDSAASGESDDDDDNGNDDDDDDSQGADSSPKCTGKFLVKGDWCEYRCVKPAEVPIATEAGMTDGTCKKAKYTKPKGTVTADVFVKQDSDLIPSSGCPEFSFPSACTPYYVIKNGLCENFCVAGSMKTYAESRSSWMAGMCNDPERGFDCFIAKATLSTYQTKGAPTAPSDSEDDETGESGGGDEDDESDGGGSGDDDQQGEDDQ